MTEFTSSEGITRSAKKTLRYLYFEPDEHFITAQLFGANPSVMADAARIAEDLGYDAVDINLGCPAKKVVKCGGSGLLRELPLLGRWMWQHFFIVIPSVMISIGMLRIVVAGEIEFRDGSYIARDRRPLLFWAAVAFFGGFAVLVMTHLARAY